jgi:hypothetical protein
LYEEVASRPPRREKFEIPRVSFTHSTNCCLANKREEGIINQNLKHRLGTQRNTVTLSACSTNVSVCVCVCGLAARQKGCYTLQSLEVTRTAKFNTINTVFCPYNLLRVPHDSHNKQPSFPYTIFTEWSF